MQWTGQPDAVVFNLTPAVSIVVNRQGVVTLMDGNELADISRTGLGHMLSQMCDTTDKSRTETKVAAAGRAASNPTYRRAC